VARIEDIPQPTRDAVAALDCPKLPGEPWVTGVPLRERTVAILSSAALHPRSEPPFKAGSAEFRELSADLPAVEIAMSHVSINFDRSGFQRDINVAYPVDRLRELARDGVIGRTAAHHYAVMGSTDPATMTETVEALVARLKRDAADAVLLCPV